LTIAINKPVALVFRFTTNPNNTPRWIDSIVSEETNEWPVRLGSVYKNQNRAGQWTEYLVAEFEENEHFTFAQKGGPYHVRYTFRPINEGATELEYFEWVEQGELEEPFTQDILENLKSVLEA